jgi:hypothetical protein
MGYYQGDFYAGTRGDPGFFSFLGKLASGGASLMGAAGAVMPGGGVLSKVGTLAKRAVGGLAKHPVLSAAGAAGAGMVLGGGASAITMHPGMRMGAAGAAGMRGFHPCKSRHGCKSGAMVRNRRMRVTNPKALRRAIRRTSGFAKLAMRTIHLVHPKKHARFGGFKRRRRKAA